MPRIHVFSREFWRHRTDKVISIFSIFKYDFLLTRCRVFSKEAIWPNSQTLTHFISLVRIRHYLKDSQRVEKVYTYLSVATKRQVYGQAEEVVYKVLESGEQVLHLLL